VSDEFFVGYLEAPAETRRRLRRVAWTVMALALLVAAALAWATGPFDRASFEFAKLDEFQGTIEAQPVPVLIAVSGERFPLVLPGKHGAASTVAPFAGAGVTLRAKRIIRGATTMLEIDPASVVRGAFEPAASGLSDGGVTTWAGEIVDSKCFLGVMNPGRLEVHRACALRCIAGGIPPMLFSHDETGKEVRLILVGGDGTPLNDSILPFVGHPVTVQGRLEHRGRLDYLYVAAMERSKTR